MTTAIWDKDQDRRTLNWEQFHTVRNVTSALSVEVAELLERYPHYPDLPLPSGIKDEFGNDLPFPAAFRKSRREHKPKGIVQIRR